MVGFLLLHHLLRVCPDDVLWLDLDELLPNHQE